MKTIKFLAIVGMLFSTVMCQAQKETNELEIKNIEKVINEFSKAGDKNDAEKLATYLDENYRIVMNRLFGSEDVSVLTKSVFVEKIKSKEFGGDKREVTVENVIVNGTTASAKVTFMGVKMTFVSLITLIQNANGDWKIIGEVPVVK